MSQAFIRFYAELNDFLPPDRKQITLPHLFEARASVKDMIEALGIPHTEVELILVNGSSVDFSYIVQDDDQISVYPVFESMDVTPLVRLRPQPLRTLRFILDAHLGKLAAYLRLLGFDTLYRNDYDDATLADLSRSDHRILLTRDRGLLKRRVVTHGYWVRESNPQQQLVEIVRRFELCRLVEPFRRCIRCNGLLQPVDKETLADKLPPNTRKTYDEFHVCSDCHQIYWKGSHYRPLVTFAHAVCADGNGDARPPTSAKLIGNAGTSP